MEILEYTGLDTSRVKASYKKICEAITRDDFRAAQVRKLANVSHGKFYRARLDDSNRLLFSPQDLRPSRRRQPSTPPGHALGAVDACMLNAHRAERMRIAFCLKSGYLFIA